MTDSHRGRLEVIHGSMFAGKTEQLISRLRKSRAAGHRAIAFKHSIDDRYDPDHLVTHRGDQFDAVRVPHPQAIIDQVGDNDVVAIDEGHFFKRDLIPVVQALLEAGRTVIIAGITHDAWGRPFEPIPDLTELADDETVLQAPCRVCGDPAPFTQRNTPANTLHMVGGLNDYEPRCAVHFSPLPSPPESR